MSNRSPRPAGMSWVSPYITVADVDAAIHFYQKAFGFKTIDSVLDDDGVTLHAELNYKDQVIMLGRENAYDNRAKAPATSGIISPIQLYLYADNVDTFYKHAVSHGAKSEQQPMDTFWGDRMCRLVDPNGYIWAFATNLGHRQ